MEVVWTTYDVFLGVTFEDLVFILVLWVKHFFLSFFLFVRNA